MQEAQACISSTEFVEWCEFLVREETEGFHREDWYMAQLACITASLGGAKVSSIDDFILEFGEPKPAPVLSPAERLRRSKAFWYGSLGLPIPED